MAWRATWSLRAPHPRAQRGLRAKVVFAGICVAAAWALEANGHARAGLDPDAHAWGATVAALLSYQALHVLLVLLMAGFVLARSWSGCLQPMARSPLDNLLPIACCVAAQGVLGILAVQLAPRLSAAA